MSHLAEDGQHVMYPEIDRRIPSQASPDPELTRLETIAAQHNPTEPQMLAIRHLEQTDKVAFNSLSPSVILAYAFWCDGERAVKALAK